VAADRELILGQVARGRGAAAVNASVRGAILGAFSCAHFTEVAAAACGEPDALAPLIAGGAAALEEQRGWVKQTALHAAAGGGYTACVTRLLDAGASPAARNVSGRTPLMRAAMGGHVGALSALLRHERCRDALDVGARDDVGDTALRLAAQDGHTGTVAALLRAGCAPDVRNDDGATPAMAAAFCGHADVLKMLFDAGAEPGAGDNDGTTALMRAAGSGAADCVTALLRAGAPPNAVDSGGWTAALCAADEGRTAALRALHAAGADFAARDAKGRSLLQLAAAGGHAEAEAFLRECAAGLVGGGDGGAAGSEPA
jgi:ankyrin repeat protein